MNYAFDRQDLLTVWLFGLPSLRTRLDLAIHGALRSRVVSPNRLRPRTREELFAMIRHGLRIAAATEKIVAEPALEARVVRPRLTTCARQAASA